MIFASMFRATDYNELYLWQDNVKPIHADETNLNGKYLLVHGIFHAEQNIFQKISNFFRKNRFFHIGHYEIRWYKNSKLHREEGPALILSNGQCQWFIDGIRQRKNGPSYISSLGDEHWLIGDTYHREDGPAVKLYGCKADCGEEWWLNGVLHREGKPALIWPDGTREWFLHGERHREDGPALDWGDDTKGWWLNDAEYTEQEFNQWLAKKQLNKKLHTSLAKKSFLKQNKI